MFKIIIYDDYTMNCFSTDLVDIKVFNSPIEIPNFDDLEFRTYVDRLKEVYIKGSGNLKETIKLDETTMKRIAKYNKEIELESIQMEIESKKKELKALEEKIEDRKERINIIHKLTGKIYKLDLDENYCEDILEYEDF